MNESALRSFRFTKIGSIVGVALGLATFLAGKPSLATAILGEPSDIGPAALGLIASGAMAGLAADVVFPRLSADQRSWPPTKWRVLVGAVCLAGALYSLLGGLWWLSPPQLSASGFKAVFWLWFMAEGFSGLPNPALSGLMLALSAAAFFTSRAYIWLLSAALFAFIAYMSYAYPRLKEKPQTGGVI